MQKLSPLKIASLVIAAAGFFVANELQRRETEEIVEKVLAEREAKQASMMEQ